MGVRRVVSGATVEQVAAEIAGHPIEAERAAGYAALYESILLGIDALRKLPMKTLEPAAVFVPKVGRPK